MPDSSVALLPLAHHSFSFAGPLADSLQRMCVAMFGSVSPLLCALCVLCVNQNDWIGAGYRGAVFHAKDAKRAKARKSVLTCMHLSVAGSFAAVRLRSRLRPQANTPYPLHISANRAKAQP